MTNVDIDSRYILFSSWAYTPKGSLEVTFFLYNRPQILQNSISYFAYGTPHMTIYGALVNRKWTENVLEVGMKWNARDLQA